MPSSLPSAADAAGTPHDIEHKGQVYHLAPVDHQDVVARYGRHLRERALAEVERVRQMLGSVAGADAMAAYLDKASAGVYDFGSPFWADSIQYRENQVSLVWFMILANHKGTPRSVAEDLYKADLEAMNRAIQGDAEPLDPTVPTTAPATPA